VICIPILGKTEAAAIRAIEKSARRCHMIELRMDLIPGGSLKRLIGASRAASPALKVLVTNRIAAQSGKMAISKKSGRQVQPPGDAMENSSDAERERMAMLQEAVALGCDYVDCELDTAETLRHKLLSTIRRHKQWTKLIISDHDFQATPTLGVLKDRLHDCLEAGADIAKIVTYARKPEDNLKILELVAYARKRRQDITAFCMGPYGTIGRVAAPLMGSCITYASLRRGLASAPGQLTVKEMRDIFRILKG